MSSLSRNQKITLGIAGLALVASAVSAYFAWDLSHEASKDKRNACIDTIAQFQSEVSSKNDTIVKEATNLKLGLNSSNAQLDDALIEYRRLVRLFEKKSACAKKKPEGTRKLIDEIDAVRTANTGFSDIKLNTLISVGRTVAQDPNLPTCCDQ